MGFHAQQAVEKLLKALLCHRHMNYERTHNLVVLMDKISDSGQLVPPEIESCKQLQPYAVQLRYDVISSSRSSAFDRVKVQAEVAAVRHWVMRLVC